MGIKRDEELRRAYEAAAADPMYMEDLMAIHREFEPLEEEVPIG